MKPLFILLIVFTITVFVIKFLTHHYNLPLAGRIAMCVMLIFTAIGHFAFTKGMEMMIPDFIPFKTEVVYLTGLMEIILGIGLLFPSTRVYSAWILIIFFMLILPANIKAAIENIDIQKASFDGPGLSYLWFRIPMQILLIIWVYISTIRI
ncbi:DoxX family protein [Cyclobacterium plantarum]|uniref:DoxX family membrane protein n=1 Tax=Cyclobacterium plantarum TaxID=2716263 RepID=A0ABX0H6Z2_9BACT|nr:hypothetical protein [Cyclobacterium plantarum]NHE57629.1 hypothetical protein [Cyclobacterium plantarum]